MSSAWFWAVLYSLNLLAFAAVFRLHESGHPVPLVVAITIAATCGVCHTMVERANALRRLRAEVDELARRRKDPKP